METLLISLILLLVVILVVITVQEIATNSFLQLREKISFIAVVIGCPPFGILFYHFFKRKGQKNNSFEVFNKSTTRNFSSEEPSKDY